MAFMGILIFAILQIVKKLMIICSGGFLIAGLLLLKTHETIAIILLVLSGLNLSGFSIWTIHDRMLKSKSQIVKTPNSTFKIDYSVISKYKKYLEKMDVEKMDKLLDIHSYMIYYPVYNNYGLLDYSMFCLNTEMMQCAINHGAVFDDLFIHSSYSWDNSLNGFWHYAEENGFITSGITTDEIINTVKFAIEHGASLTYTGCSPGFNNLYEQVSEWVRKDNVISPKDEELLSLIKEYLPENYT